MNDSNQQTDRQTDREICIHINNVFVSSQHLSTQAHINECVAALVHVTQAHEYTSA